MQGRLNYFLKCFGGSVSRRCYEVKNTYQPPNMKKRIAIVEDDQDALKLLQIILTLEGFQADAYLQANDVLQDNVKVPDLYLVDINLGNASGLDLCKQLKAQTDTSHIPVIMISSSTDIREQTREACADDMLAKPFTSKTLVQKIHEYLPA